MLGNEGLTRGLGLSDTLYPLLVDPKPEVLALIYSCLQRSSCLSSYLYTFIRDAFWKKIVSKCLFDKYTF